MGSPGQVDSLVTVLDLVRSVSATTRPAIARASGLGRNVVTQRVAQLLDSGLLTEGALGISTGGRPSRQVRFRADSGHVLAAQLGATSIAVALADLSGRLVGHCKEPAAVTAGPEPVLARVEEMFRELLDKHGGGKGVWGVGIGLPGPVEFRSGRPIAPPIMPGWDGFDVRGYFALRHDAPVWVDNDVNVMVLGELRCGLARGERDVIYVKVGTGIGAGLVSSSHLHRGAQGCAGDIGHIAVVTDASVVCRCGKVGCLEALAGGSALARDGAIAARECRSVHLARLAAVGHEISSADVGRAAEYGDPVAVELLTRSATLVGEAIARLVNFFNPALILLGGGVAESGDLYLATVRQAVFAQSLPLATRSLQLVRSPMSDRAGLTGAAFMVIDELMSCELIAHWIDSGSPAGQPQLTA